MIRTLPMIALLLIPAGNTLANTPTNTIADLPAAATKAAAEAERRYDDAQVELLADLVRFKTVHTPGSVNAEQPEFRAFAEYLRARADEFGLDFTDHGAVLVIGLGEAKQRLGIITHGDVQPADATKWQRSPFELDAVSEPGRLIARGAEDDKAPIATALYAMKTIKELGLPLERRIELIVALTEESDWAPFRAVLEHYTPPEMNIAIDSQYPVVVAEKGFGVVRVTFPSLATDTDQPLITDYSGGAFVSQVPEDARIALRANDEQLNRLRTRAAAAGNGVTYRFEQHDGHWLVHAKGKAAHSSTPENGINALAHLAALLKDEAPSHSPAARALDFVNTLIGTGIHGRQFGNIAFAHSFMGPLTVNLSTARNTANGIELAINLRAPAGKPMPQLETEIRAAIADWAKARELPLPAIEITLTDAYLPEQPKQVEPLLAVFRHYTGIHDVGPVSIGGGTNARLMPNAVNFGPTMPGKPYTGHSEHEFITREQMTLNLRMYTAMMAWLASEPL